MTVRLIHADCLEAMRGMPDASVDSVVTDPPYGLGFMGRAWDHGIPGVPFWSEMLRVLKPGGHIVAFGGTRTYHRMACAIEDAGFEIRDQLSWIYGSGFPKSQNVGKAFDRVAGAEREVVGVRRVSRDFRDISGGRYGDKNAISRERDIGVTAPATDLAKQWDGWGSALKPAHEPICLARKPLVGTVAANVAAHGTGAINIDGCRVEGEVPRTGQGTSDSIYGGGKGLRPPDMGTQQFEPHASGRWPANLCHDGSDEVLAAFARFGERAAGRFPKNSGGIGTDSGIYGKGVGRDQDERELDAGTATRFFYTAKASREEREIGLYDHPLRERGQKYGLDAGGNLPQQTPHKHSPVRNTHPTVKPLALMQWLCRLVTPPGGTVLDPFLGSGSTAIAADREGFSCIGVEREAEYVEIARRRIAGDAGLFAEFAA